MDERFQIAVEDKFVIIKLYHETGLLPDGECLQILENVFRVVGKDYKIVLDVSGIKAVTNDVLTFLRSFPRAQLIMDASELSVHKRQANDYASDSIFHWYSFKRKKITPVFRPRWLYTDLPLDPLLKIDESIMGLIENGGVRITKNEIEKIFCDVELADDMDFHLATSSYNVSRVSYESASTTLGSRYMLGEIERLGRRSLMSQLHIVNSRGQLLATPIHSSAAYGVDTSSGTVATRPGIIARKTANLFKGEIDEFNYLMNEESSRERDFQKFFERNPSFLSFLGYKAIYPQVVLERDGGKKLIPDFIAEPIHSEWCDIIDIKRPNMPLIIGARDRKDFSAQVYQLRAQLREYSNYFEEERYRKFIKQKYGLSVYRPRLVGVIGSHVNASDAEQVRRVMTDDPQFQVVTFEQLRRAALTRLLF